MFSVICVYNNKDLFESVLCKSLQHQTVPFELVAIDNTRHRFSSAAAALNFGAQEASEDSEYYIFVHQDIDLGTDLWLAQAESILKQLPDVGVAGVAGLRPGDRTLLSNITHGSPPVAAGRRRLSVPIKVQTVDECLLIIPRKVFDVQRFDDEVCAGWHMYGVDYCLGIARKGFAVYVLPLCLHHLSLGTRTRDYYQTLGRVLKKHKGKERKIYTTCGVWNTRIPLWMQLVFFFVREFFYAVIKTMRIRRYLPARTRNKTEPSNLRR